MNKHRMTNSRRSMEMLLMILIAAFAMTGVSCTKDEPAPEKTESEVKIVQTEDKEEPEETPIWEFISNGDGTCQIALASEKTDAALGTVEIPSVSPNGDTITSIRESAFADCTGLLSVTFPSTIVRIGANAFSGCTGLKEVTLPECLSIIENGSFDGCEQLKTVTYEGSELDWGAVRKPQGCFQEEAEILFLTETPEFDVNLLFFESNGDGTCCAEYLEGMYDGFVVIPSVSPEGDAVTSIGQWAAYGSCVNITGLAIPASVVDIPGWLLAYAANLKKIVVDANNPVYFSRGNCIIEKETGRVVYGCNTSVLSDEVKSIGSDAFTGYDELTYSLFPSSITNVEKYAFTDCAKLANVVLPEMTDILWSIFVDCENLKSITFPKTMERLCSGGCWYDCPEISELLVDEQNPIYYSSGNCVIKKDGEVLVCGCRTSVIPDEVKEIAPWAFSYYKALETIIIPENVIKIGRGAFKECTSLKKITFLGTQSQWDAVEKGADWCPEGVEIEVKS